MRVNATFIEKYIFYSKQCIFPYGVVGGETNHSTLKMKQFQFDFFLMKKCLIFIMLCFLEDEYLQKTNDEKCTILQTFFL